MLGGSVVYYHEASPWAYDKERTHTRGHAMAHRINFALAVIAAQPQLNVRTSEV